MDKKEKKQREQAYESLPPTVRDSLSPEEKQLFLAAELWPETLFEKLDEFIVKP